MLAKTGEVTAGLAPSITKPVCGPACGKDRVDPKGSNQAGTPRHSGSSKRIGSKWSATVLTTTSSRQSIGIGAPSDTI